ncbi:MauE/DoxX family redox-associated membrane protein [Sphingomonas sp. CJ20]
MSLVAASAAALAVAARVLLGLVLLQALTGKLRAPGAFVAAVGAYRIAPDALRAPLALAILGAEAGLGVALLAGVARQAALAGTAGLLLCFAGAIAINLRRGRAYIDCGCAMGSARRPISRGLALANVALAGAALAAAVPAATLPGLAVANGYAAGFVLFLLFNLVALLGDMRRMARGTAQPVWSVR